MKHVIRKIILISFGIVYLGMLFKIARSSWAAAHSTIETYSQTIESNPGNPDLWTEYANVLLNERGVSDSPAAVNAYRQAILLNPLNPLNWDGLVAARVKTGDNAEAEAALRAWLLAIPHSPDAQWRLGNLLILQDRISESLPYLREAGRATFRYRAPLFDIAWKALADPEEILSDLIPADPNVREEYLYFLLQTKRVADAPAVWKQVRGDGGARILNLGSFYADVLAGARMGADAANVWADVLASSGRGWTKPAGEMMTNGDFEGGLFNKGLDWRFTPQPGSKITLDDTTAQSGSHSLRISFDGSSNPDFYHVRQSVPIDPDRDYRFSAYVKTEDITSNNGVLFEVELLDPPPGGKAVFTTENSLGTNPWTLHQIDFRTGPSTHVVDVRLRRYVSSKLNNLIKGTVWIDNVSIKPRL